MALDVADSLLELTDLAGGREKTGVKGIGYRGGGIREGGCEAWDDVAGALRDRDSHFSQQATDGVETCGARGQPGRAQPVKCCERLAPPGKSARR